MVFSINKSDCHDITEKLLKVALNTITLTLAAEYMTIVALFSLVFFGAIWLLLAGL